jgi:hypothetical protein
VGHTIKNSRPRPRPWDSLSAYGLRNFNLNIIPTVGFASPARAGEREALHHSVRVFAFVVSPFINTTQSTINNQFDDEQIRI